MAGSVKRTISKARRQPFTTANNAAGAVQGYLAKEADRELVGKGKGRAMASGSWTVTTESKAGGFLGGKPAYRYVIKQGGTVQLRSDANYPTAASARAAGRSRLSTIKSNIATHKRNVSRR